MSLLISSARQCDNHQLINIETWKGMMKFPPQKLADDLLEVITVEGDGNLFSSLYRFSTDSIKSFIICLQDIHYDNA
jgi:hypothetical protein